MLDNDEAFLNRGKKILFMPCHTLTDHFSSCKSYLYLASNLETKINAFVYLSTFFWIMKNNVKYEYAFKEQVCAFNETIVQVQVNSDPNRSVQVQG